MRTATLALLGLGFVAGCGGDRPPPIPLRTTVQCRTTAVRCPEALRDGVCPTPGGERFEDPYREGRACGPEDATAEEAREACERVFCGPCIMDDTCHSCEVAEATIVSTIGCSEGRGFIGGSGSSGGGGRDGGVDGGEPTPAPEPGTLEILTFTYDQPAVGAPVISDEPFRRIALDPGLTPVRGMSAQGLLWVLSDAGILVGFDMAADPPRLLVGPHDLGLLLDEGVLTPNGLTTWALSGSDFVNLVVGAEEGLFFFHVDVPRDDVTLNPVRQFREGTVDTFALHPQTAFRLDGYVVIGTGMAPALWLAESLGELPTTRTNLLTHLPTSITMETVPRGDVWVALTGAPLLPDRFELFRGSPLAAVAASDRPGEIVRSVSGGDSGTTVVADAIVALTRSPAGDSGAVLAYAGGDIDAEPARLDFDERVVTASTKRISDVLFVFVVTTGSVHRLRIFRIDAIPESPHRTFVELLEHEIAFAPVRLSLGNIPEGPGPASGLLHVLVAP